MLVTASSASRRSAGAAALVLAAVLALSGCGGSSTAGTTSQPDVPSTTTAVPRGSHGPTGPAAAPAPVPEGSHLPPNEFAAAVTRPGTVILDVRTTEEFLAGHLPGAINADVESPGFGAALAGLDPAMSYAVYCQSGRRSGIALDEMGRAGFAHAYDLAGGITAWSGAGGPVVNGP